MCVEHPCSGLVRVIAWKRSCRALQDVSDLCRRQLRVGFEHQSNGSGHLRRGKARPARSRVKRDFSRRQSLQVRLGLVAERAVHTGDERAAQGDDAHARRHQRRTKQRAAERPARREISHTTMLIRRPHADDPRRDRVRIERVKPCARVARREDDVDAVLGQQLSGDVDRIVVIKSSVGGKAAIDDPHIQRRAVAKQVIETRQHEREIHIARAEAQNARARSDAAVLAAGARAVSGYQARDKSPVAVNLIRVRQALYARRIAEPSAHALRVKQLDVTHHAPRKVRVRTVHSGIEHCDRHVAARDRQAAVSECQVSVNRDARRAVESQPVIQIQLQSPVAIYRTHG